MMKLYWCPRSRSFSALWLMEEVGEPYERVLIDITTGAQKTSEYLAINPMGKVPALKDGDVTVAEPRRSAPMSPSGTMTRTSPRRSAIRFAQNICNGCSLAGLHRTCDDRDLHQDQCADIDRGMGSATQVFDVLNAALEKGPYLLGDMFSAADIMIGSGLNFATPAFKMVPARPSFDRYIDICSARPAFQRATALAAG